MPEPSAASGLSHESPGVEVDRLTVEVFAFGPLVNSRVAS